MWNLIDESDFAIKFVKNALQTMKSAMVYKVSLNIENSFRKSESEIKYLKRGCYFEYSVDDKE